MNYDTLEKRLHSHACSEYVSGLKTTKKKKEMQNIKKYPVIKNIHNIMQCVSLTY